jgi:hypothetical protein
MATPANAEMTSVHREHTFDELGTGSEMNCELCKQERAAYAWSQRNGATAKAEMHICRVCAGMILLIGKPS